MDWSTWIKWLSIHVLSDSRLGEFRRHSFSKYLVIVLFHMHLANITYLSFTHYLTTWYIARIELVFLEWGNGRDKKIMIMIRKSCYSSKLKIYQGRVNLSIICMHRYISWFTKCSKCNESATTTTYYNRIKNRLFMISENEWIIIDALSESSSVLMIYLPNRALHLH